MSTLISSVAAAGLKKQDELEVVRALQANMCKKRAVTAPQLSPAGAGKRQNLEPTKSHHELLHCAGIAISGSLRFTGRREVRCPSRFAEPDIALAALAGLGATLFMPRDDKVAYNAEVKRIVLIVREKFSLLAQYSFAYDRVFLPLARPTAVGSAFLENNICHTLAHFPDPPTQRWSCGSH